jgi:hypothetical protein
VIIARTSNATVGGDDAGSRNTIAFNANDGVVLPGAPPEMGNRFLQNAIFDNGDLGIDLNNDGRTRNDPLNADGGPNQLQNWPELTAATRSGGVTTVTGRLRSAPNEAFALRFFSSPTGGEGKVFRGQLTVATNTNGVSPVFSFRSPTAIPVGHTVTATATDDSRYTSEFSGPWVVSAA